MIDNYKIQKYEAICLILIIMVNKLILNIPYYIIELARYRKLYKCIIYWYFRLTIYYAIKSFI